MRRPESRQLRFAFADNPQGGGTVRPSDVSEGRDVLLRIAKAPESTDSGARTDDTSRLFDRVVSPRNLAGALLNVARNHGAPGVDQMTVEDAIGTSRKLLPRLRSALLQGSYRPGDVRRVWIPKPDGGQRGLGIPNVVDRWTQQAVLQALEPIFDPSFHPCSHGFRPRRGAQTALADVRRHLADGYTWLVNIDLSKFFDRVHHQRLLARLKRRIEDTRVLMLVKRMLKAKVAMPDGVRVSQTEGTPQGGPLSPLLSNIVLDELDQELERRGLRFVRYADDFIVFTRSERAAYRVMDSVTRFIEKRLRLQVNRDKSSVTRPEDSHFLGFRFHVDAEGHVDVLLSERSYDRIYARLVELTPRNFGGPLESCMAEISRYGRGWMSHFKLLTAAGAQRLSTLDAHVRRRLRAIIIRHKRRPRNLFRHLLARNVSYRSAWKAAYSTKGIWRRSCSPGMHRGYPNQWFADRMMLLWSAWERLRPTRATGLLPFGEA